MIIHKLGIFKDTVLDRQITALVDAANLSASPVEVVPGPPTALTAVGRLLAIELQVTFPRAANVQVEIWVSTTNERSTAVLLGTSVDGVVQHQGLESGAFRYYWARTVTAPTGFLSGWYPASPTAGIAASASTNASDLIHLLNSNVDDTKLLAYLSGGASLLDVLDTHPRLFEVGTIGAGVTATYTDALRQAASQMNKNKSDVVALNAVVAGLTNIDYDNAHAYIVGEFVKYSGAVYQCITAGTGHLPTDAAYWITSNGIIGLISTVHADLDAATNTWSVTAAALTADITGIDTRLISAEASINVGAEEIAIITTSIIGSMPVVEIGVVEPGVLVVSVADVPSIGLEMSRAKIGLDTATGRIDLLSTRVSDTENRISAAEIEIDGATAAINLKASIATVTALSQVVSEAQIAINAANSAIALKASQESLDITNGTITTQSGELDIVKDRITMRLDNNGNVAGMVMGWNAPDSSEIAFIANVFKICQPDGSTLKQVFTVGNIGGQPTVGINGDLIIDGTIPTAKITDAAITTALIRDASITTAKIDLAQITTALIADATITTALIADAQITTAKIATAQITTALIHDAAITTAQIADATITTGKIATAQVNTLQIKGDAVTVPVAATIGAGTLSDEWVTVASINYVVDSDPDVPLVDPYDPGPTPDHRLEHPVAIDGILYAYAHTYADSTDSGYTFKYSGVRTRLLLNGSVFGPYTNWSSGGGDGENIIVHYGTVALGGLSDVLVAGIHTIALQACRFAVSGLLPVAGYTGGVLKVMGVKR
jgi:hypothetical protein